MTELEKDSNTHISIDSVIKDFERLTIYLSEIKKYNLQENISFLSEKQSAQLKKGLQFIEEYKYGIAPFSYLFSVSLAKIFALQYYNEVHTISAILSITLLSVNITKLPFKKKKVDIIGQPTFTDNNHFLSWAKNQFLENKLSFFLSHRLKQLKSYNLPTIECSQLEVLNNQIKELISTKNNDTVDYYEKLNLYAQEVVNIHYNVEDNKKDFNKLGQLQNDVNKILININEESHKNQQKKIFKNNL